MQNSKNQKPDSLKIIFTKKFRIVKSTMVRLSKNSHIYIYLLLIT